jgi:subtilisin family serine protease
MKFISLFAGLLILPFLSMAENVSIETAYMGNPALYNAYKGLDDLGVKDAWDMGYTGVGVKVAIMDSGVDFATPDLIGTQARVSNASSPYYGWPIVIDPDSLSSYQQGVFGYRSQYANTTSTDTKGYHMTGTSKSGIYHIGDHPDSNLAQFYGKPVKILLVDEKTPGVYDTVYVDLNSNHDFRDDKPCRKGDEISYWDRDNDGYPDESGGMIYFIADGKTPLPLSRMLYGENAEMPKNGELVAFHCDDGNHGTMCASIIAAQGKNVKGIAPDARIIPVRLFGANDKHLCLIASLGYDGIPNTDDEADIISRSGGIRGIFNKGADEGSAFLEYLTTKISPSTTLVYANGNDGSGYGTCDPPSGEHVINVGATYDLWWNSSSLGGDVACFSSRGPNALGQVKPNVLAPGDRTPEVLPLWIAHDGKAAWDGWGGGTSGATPHVAAVIALIYQAYKDAHGEFPTSEKARDILMSSATDIDEEIFAQGSGIINAKRAVEVASEKDGVLVEPALLVTSPVEAGSDLRFNLTLSNYSGKPIDLKPQILIKDKTKNLTFKSGNESIFFVISRDMLDCDLIKVSSYYSRTARNTRLDKDEGYDLYLYSWKDTDGDRKAHEGELEVIAGPFYDWGYGFTSEVRMHNPAERLGDEILAELKKRGEIESREIQIVIETYKWKTWNIEMNIDDNNVSISIPTPNTTGVYQGKISLEGDGERKCIPISFSTYRNDEIKINNNRDIYENSKIYGRFEGDGKSSWDSRFYPIYHNGHNLATIEVAWEDPNTDIDVYLYGESVFNSSKIWKYPTKPPIELPKLRALKENGHSLRILGTIFMVQGDMVRGGPSYSAFYTSTGKNKEVITGELTNGLNLIILRQVVPGGNKYGENITIDINVTSFNPIDLGAKAGEPISFLSSGIDGIMGFSTGEVIRDESGPKTFKAKKGDVILIDSNDTSYLPQIFLDSNENGTIDWDIDVPIFAEQRYNEINPSYTDIIPINKSGTYFLSGNCEFYHIKNRYENNSNAPMKIKAPEQAGTYLGLAEIGGNFIPIPVKLVVTAGEPTSICLDTANRTVSNLPFEVKLEVQDKFGNLVENDTATAVIEFNGTTKNVDLVKGKNSINLTAPEKTGIYKIKAQSRYGISEKDIEIIDKIPIETGNTSINGTEIEEKMDQIGDTRGPAPTKQIKDLPKKVESVSSILTSGNISLTWQASEDADYYNVYRLKGVSSEKLAEVKSPEYTLKGELWKSYTFRVSAVNREGNESELGDPVGIVVTP